MDVFEGMRNVEPVVYCNAQMARGGRGKRRLLTGARNATSR